jgi:hypothetical protein
MPPASLLFAAFSKVDEQDDGTLKVYGIASSESTDSAGEIVKATAMRAALPDYLTFGAVREMHQPIAAGTAISCTVDDEGVTHLAAHVVDPASCLKVRTQVLKGFSIGGRVTKRNALNKNVIEGIKLTEISLVDRPANPDALISLAKIDGSGKVALSKVLTEKKETTPLVKSLYDVGELADLIQRLNCLMMWAADEANWEGDNSDVPARLKETVAALCLILRDMVDEETQELLGIADEVITPEVLELAAKSCASLEKKGAKFSKATVGALATVHKMLADGCAMMDGLAYTKVDNQEDDTMTDAEKADLAKAQARVVELEQQNAELTASVTDATEKLGKATKAAEDATLAAKTATEQAQKVADLVEPLLAKAKGSVRAVPKGADGNGQAPADDLNKGDKKPDMMAEIHSAHSRPLSPIRASA